MLHSTNKKHAEQLNTQSNTDDNHNSQSEKGYERVQIPNSPFWLIGEPERGYAAVIADFQITNMMKTKEEVTKALEDNHWEVIYRMIGIVTAKILEEEKKEQARQWNESFGKPEFNEIDQYQKTREKFGDSI